MELAPSTWTVVGIYLAVTFALGLWFSRRAGRSTEEYFLSGRSLPWWILGTSMVVTTFAPDTPLGVAEYSRSGLFNNWFGWHMVMGQILAVVLFSRLWRRSGVMTDNQLLELRYEGKPAAALRGFKACHFALIYNLIALSTVIGAMVTVVTQVTNLQDAEMVRWILAGTALLYCVLAGFWGVIATDFIQFWLAVVGTALFAWLASDQLGGVEAVREAVSPTLLDFWPDAPGEQAKVVVFVCVMWWGHANADGGGYLIQRMLAAKSERHASLGTLWFSFAYAAVRMWPWILVGSFSLVLLPAIAVSEGEVLVNGRAATEVTGTVLVDGRETEVSGLAVTARDGAAVVPGAEGATVSSVKGKEAYPRLMKHVLTGHPILLGILLSAFLAAFMSTVDTHLNWGASYLVNDVLRRFVLKDTSERKLVWIAKGTVVLLMIAAIFGSQVISSIKNAWIFVWAISAGIGPIILLRWFWWRINAWSEITALGVSLGLALSFELSNWLHDPETYVFAARKGWVFGVALDNWQRALIIVGTSIASALAVTLLTRPVSRERLGAFVKLVRPPGAWRAVRGELTEEVAPDHSVPMILVLWVCGVAAVYGATFLIGGLLYGRVDLASGAVVSMVLGGLGLWRLMRRRPGGEARTGASRES